MQQDTASVRAALVLAEGLGHNFAPCHKILEVQSQLGQENKLKTIVVLRMLSELNAARGERASISHQAPTQIQLLSCLNNQGGVQALSILT